MTRAACAGLLLAALLAASAAAAPIDPAIDPPDQPFCYFSRPSDVLGFADAREGTQVVAEGWLFTGRAELMFFSGNPLKPIRQRIRTLEDGHLPILHYSVKRDGIEYRFRMFAYTLNGKPEGQLVNFIRVTVANTTSSPAEAIFAVGFRYYGPHGRCSRMLAPVAVQRARYEMRGGLVLRDGAIIYTYPLRPAPELLAAPDVPYSGPFTGDELKLTKHAPCCLVRYRLKLAPSQAASLDFKMPYFPVPADSRDARALAGARFDDYLRRCRRFWQRFLAAGMQIELPERKVVDAYKANLIFDAIARDKIGQDYVVKVNEFQYDAFWVRDGAYIVNAFDQYGYHRWAEQGLEYFLKQQREDGIIYQPPQLDGWGQALWVFGQHYKLTRDRRWAERVYPKLLRSALAILDRVGKDPLGMVPPAPPYDNEAINGHYTGHNFWALVGIANLIAIARDLGHDADAAALQRRWDAYKQRFLRLLDQLCEKTGGYITPGLDVPDGCDWGNLHMLFPTGGDPADSILEPTDPRVAHTLQLMREKKYAEGIMTYGRGLRVGALHQYLTFKCTANYVVMGDQRRALEDFYAILAHTSSTHAGYEFGIRPWDNRDPGGNFPPHGWFAAKYLMLLRDMLVREWRGDLHVFSCLSPAWIKPGATIAVRGAPTDFGRVTAVARVGRDGMAISLSARWHRPPRSIIVHIPWFMKATAALADGKRLQPQDPPFGQGQILLLPPTARSVRISWQQVEQPNLSYQAAVEAWKAEYKRRYEEFIAKGGKPEPLWLEREIPMTAAQRGLRYELLRLQQGIAVGCKATASHSEHGHPPENACNGIVSRNDYWGATPYPAWWQVDLGKTRTIDRIRVIPYFGDRRFYRYKVEVSTDGQNWQLVADMSKNEQLVSPRGFLHIFEPVKARYVRVTMLYNSANPGVHLSEVQVYEAFAPQAAEPPASFATAWSAAEQTRAARGDADWWQFIGAERVVIRGSAVKRGGSKVRIVFRASANKPNRIGFVTIAPFDEDPLRPGKPVARLGFGGAAMVDLPPGREVATDWVEFPLQPGRDYVVTFYVDMRGGAAIWSDENSPRYESNHPVAPFMPDWSLLSPHKTFNIYFVDRIEVGE